MKRKLIVSLSFIWTILIGIAMVWTVWGKKTAGEYTFDNHSCSNGNLVYASENRSTQGYLYCMDEKNTVVHMAETGAVAKDSVVADVAYEEGLYALLQSEREKEGERTSVYRIAHYSPELVLLDKSLELETTEEGFISGFSVENGQFYLTFLSGDGAEAFVYGIDKESCMLPAGAENGTEADEEPEAVLLTDGRKFTADEDRFFVKARYKQEKLEAQLDDGSGKESFFPEENCVERFENKVLPVSDLVRQEKELLTRSLVLWIGGLFVLCFMAVVLRKRNRLVYMAVILESVLLVFVVAGTGLLYQGQKKAAEEEYRRFSRFYMEKLMTENENLAKVFSETEDYYVSGEYWELQGSLTDYVKSPGTADIFYEICVVRMQDRQIIASAGGRNTQTAEELYTKKAGQIVEKLTEGNVWEEDVVEIGAQRYGLIGMAPSNVMQPSYVLLALTNDGSSKAEAGELLLWDSFLGAAAFLMGSIFCMIVLLFQSRDLKHLEEAMVRVADGDAADVTKPSVYGNEMETMWSSLFETDRAIKKINYSKFRIFEAYYRFAPKQIETILQKNSIVEVENGDVRRMRGTMAIISMKEPKQELSESMESMNHFIAALEKRQQEQQGIFISNDCNLSLLKLLFLEQGGDTAQFGVDLTHDLQDDQFLSGMQTTVFLHQTEFLYGVAGTKSQSFPFLKSDESAKYEAYTKWLREMKLRLVVTEQVKEEKCRDKEVRYIGYIGESRGPESVKLYEVLEACPAKERREKIDTREKFKTALELFYQYDFYLARSAFADILKEMPYDDISKWYLFTCEKYLNERKQGAINCGLCYTE